MRAIPTLVLSKAHRYMKAEGLEGYAKIYITGKRGRVSTPPSENAQVWMSAYISSR